MKNYSFSNEVIFTHLNYIEFYSIHYIFSFSLFEQTENNKVFFIKKNLETVFPSKIINNRMTKRDLKIKIISTSLSKIQSKIQLKRFQIIKKFFCKKIISFDINFYQLILNYRTVIYSEKFWLNFFSTKNSVSKIFCENFKFFKNKKFLLLFQLESLIWCTIENYVTKISKILFYFQKYYLNVNYSFLFTKKFCSYSFQIYSFLFSHDFFKNKLCLKLEKNIKKQQNNLYIQLQTNVLTNSYPQLYWFCHRQICKKCLLQLVLTTRQESILSLTNNFSTLNRTIYDSVEYLYEILNNKPMFTFRIDFFNHLGFFNRNPIFSRVFNWILNEKSNFFDFSLNNNNRSSNLFLSKIQIFHSIFTNQTFYLIKTQFCRKLEKYNIYNYYRIHCNHLSFFDMPYKNYNNLIQFKNSFLQICLNEKIIIEHSKVFSKWFLKFGFQFFKTGIANSYTIVKTTSYSQLHKYLDSYSQLHAILNKDFSLFQQKVGFFFYGFYFIQQKRNSLQILYPQRKIKNQMSLNTNILPSKYYLKEYLNQLKHIIKNSTMDSQEVLIQKLKNKIEIWSQYYQISTDKKIFNFCDYKIFNWLWKWACRRHPNKSRHWIKKKYFISQTNSKNHPKWVFCFYNQSKKCLLCLPEHKQIFLVRHIRVRQYISNYDETWRYWLKRFSLNCLCLYPF